MASPAHADPALAGSGGWIPEALPSCLFFSILSGSSLVQLYGGIWKLFLFTRGHQDAALCCAPANGNLGFPAGSFQRLHAKQPAVLQGASGPCYISAEKALPSVQAGHPGLAACRLLGELLSYLERSFFYCCFVFEGLPCWPFLSTPSPPPAGDFMFTSLGWLPGSREGS